MIIKISVIMVIQDELKSGWASEIHIDLDTTGNSDSSHLFNLSKSAFKIDITFIDCHLKIIPSFGSLAAWGPSGVDSEMLIGESNWAFNFNICVLGLSDEFVSNRLHGRELISGKCYPSSFDLLIFKALFFDVFLSHNKWIF